ncbi:hypothetical protein K402DRAFT_396333 [Aulographum hederae CBS 113979]|uniref:Uncharacterized protein n=1 Tax=Aulographum hederae CBS 113979 TaxID=1176131 RepID=A0A6G1GSV0_9PEZI|nr:hypothetical protein K402DRAFT_396333 [Aulographum hederae CBS 113979]
MPPEIRNEIYHHAFSGDAAVVDPAWEGPKSLNSKGPHISSPALGTGLLRTCQRLYSEADVRTLYSNNIFRFTSVPRIHNFARGAPESFRDRFGDVEIDVRELSKEHPSVARDWIQYLSWATDAWAEKLGSMKADFPAIHTLRLNLASWPRINMDKDDLWVLLKNLLKNVEGLDRIIVTGASKGAWMEKQEPWSPMHFVGGDNVTKGDLVEWMAGTVYGEPGNKAVQWTRKNGQVQLEVFALDGVPRRACAKLAQNWQNMQIKQLPPNGHCTLHAYSQRKKAPLTKSKATRVSPSVSG